MYCERKGGYICQARKSKGDEKWAGLSFQGVNIGEFKIPTRLSIIVGSYVDWLVNGRSVLRLVFFYIVFNNNTYQLIAEFLRKMHERWHVYVSEMQTLG